MSGNDPLASLIPNASASGHQLLLVAFLWVISRQRQERLFFKSTLAPDVVWVDDGTLSFSPQSGESRLLACAKKHNDLLAQAHKG
ncbi:hypothetical protein ABU178_01640 [Pantoea osteomyelitidis]|uniref:Uncharacterized protein n=1 Tax=Pantoea osteomyelitidis TaxID=3230026 RepID=A0ABW7PSX9_9GAMM